MIRCVPRLDLFHGCELGGMKTLELKFLSLPSLFLRKSTKFNTKRWRTSTLQFQIRQSSSEPRRLTGMPVMYASLPSFFIVMGQLKWKRLRSIRYYSHIRNSKSWPTVQIGKETKTQKPNKQAQTIPFGKVAKNNAERCWKPTAFLIALPSKNMTLSSNSLVAFPRDTWCCLSIKCCSWKQPNTVSNPDAVTCLLYDSI